MLKHPRWICNICKQTFTRKWNAKRHCKTYHESLFDSIIFFNEYMTVTKTTNKTFPTLHNQNVYSYNDIHLPHNENLFFEDNSPLKPSIDPNLLSTQTPKDDFTKLEMLLSNILISLAPKYEEIEHLLSDTPEPNKTKILGGIVSRAVYDDNPVRFINNKLKELRKTMLYNKMLDAASVFHSSDRQSTKEHLKKGIREHALY